MTKILVLTYNHHNHKLASFLVLKESTCERENSSNITSTPNLNISHNLDNLTPNNFWDIHSQGLLGL